MNYYPSHVGDLPPIEDDANGYASYGPIQAMRPSLFPGPNSVANRSMAVYERPDDFGLGPTGWSANNGSMGRPIACCNVQLFRIFDP